MSSCVSQRCQPESLEFESFLFILKDSFAKFPTKSVIRPLRQTYILYHVMDSDFVKKILQPQIDPTALEERRVISLCMTMSTDTLHTWHDILRDRCDPHVVVVVLSHRYLQVLRQSSEYRTMSTSIKEIHRRHKTLVIQLEKIAAEALYEFFGDTWPKVNWFTWPEQEEERLGFWDIFGCHIDQ